jgi:hypothetical protein
MMQGFDSYIFSKEFRPCRVRMIKFFDDAHPMALRAITTCDPLLLCEVIRLGIVFSVLLLDHTLLTLSSWYPR